MERNHYVAPRDPDSIEKLRNVLSKQFAVEIENKNQQLTVVEERLNEVSNIWNELQHLWSKKIYSEQILQYNNSKKDKKSEVKSKRVSSGHEKNSKKRSLDEATGSAPPNSPPNSTPSHPKPQTKIKEEDEDLKEGKRRKRNIKQAGDLFARKPDGQYVQLVCPACKRTSFATQLGFANHCRIMHKIKFSTYEDQAIHCGIPVDESRIPMDDPVRMKSLSHLVNEKKAAFGGGGIDLTLEGEDGSLQEAEWKAPVNVHPDAVVEEASTFGNSSRFYVKKTIICGNSSQKLQKEANQGVPEGATHKWIAYVRGPDEDPHLEHFLKKVRFFLHPSFAPFHIVDVVSSPFQISRFGWGEFPLRIQLHFIDPKNKPINVIHHLKLDFSDSIMPHWGGETVVNVELDKHFFEDSVNKKETLELEVGKGKVENEIERIKEIEEPKVETFLIQEAEKWPLISEKKGSLPYACASSVSQWEAWDHSKRKSSEWQRSRRIRLALAENLGIQWSTKKVLCWLSEHGMTPPYPPYPSYEVLYSEEIKVRAEEKLFVGASKKSISQKIPFCKYCGIPHVPINLFEKLEKECGDSRPFHTYTTFKSFSSGLIQEPSNVNGVISDSSSLVEDIPMVHSIPKLLINQDPLSSGITDINGSSTATHSSSVTLATNPTQALDLSHYSPQTQTQNNAATQHHMSVIPQNPLTHTHHSPPHPPMVVIPQNPQHTHPSPPQPPISVISQNSTTNPTHTSFSQTTQTKHNSPSQHPISVISQNPSNSPNHPALSQTHTQHYVPSQSYATNPTHNVISQTTQTQHHNTTPQPLISVVSHNPHTHNSASQLPVSQTPQTQHNVPSQPPISVIPQLPQTHNHHPPPQPPISVISQNPTTNPTHTAISHTAQTQHNVPSQLPISVIPQNSATNPTHTAMSQTPQTQHHNTAPQPPISVASQKFSNPTHTVISQTPQHNPPAQTPSSSTSQTNHTPSQISFVSQNPSPVTVPLPTPKPPSSIRVSVPSTSHIPTQVHSTQAVSSTSGSLPTSLSLGHTSSSAHSSLSPSLIPYGPSVSLSIPSPSLSSVSGPSLPSSFQTSISPSIQSSTSIPSYQPVSVPSVPSTFQSLNATPSISVSVPSVSPSLPPSFQPSTPAISIPSVPSYLPLSPSIPGLSLPQSISPSISSISSMNIPSSLSINNPSSLSMSTPSSLSMNTNTTSLSINNPSSLSMNNTSSLSINNPSSLTLNNPSSLSINTPSSLSMNTPSSLSSMNTPSISLSLPQPTNSNSLVSPAFFLNSNYPSTNTSIPQSQFNTYPTQTTYMNSQFNQFSSVPSHPSQSNLQHQNQYTSVTPSTTYNSINSNSTAPPQTQNHSIASLLPTQPNPTNQTHPSTCDNPTLTIPHHPTPQDILNSPNYHTPYNNPQDQLNSSSTNPQLNLNNSVAHSSFMSMMSTDINNAIQVPNKPKSVVHRPTRNLLTPLSKLHQPKQPKPCPIPIPPAIDPSTPQAQSLEFEINDEDRAWLNEVVGEVGVELKGEEEMVVQNMLFKAARCFVKSFSQSILKILEEEKKKTDPTLHKFQIVVPGHIQQACLNHPLFDFLTNQGLQADLPAESHPKDQHLSH